MSGILQKVLLPAVTAGSMLAVGFLIFMPDTITKVGASYIFVAFFSITWITQGFGYSQYLAIDRRLDQGGQKPYILFHLLKCVQFSLTPALLVGAYIFFVIPDLSTLGAMLFTYIAAAVIYGLLLIGTIVKRKRSRC